MDIATLARNIVVVLVEPQHSGNIGSVARGMKNMGLHQLVLVNPPAYDPERARWMAPGCSDLLANARIVHTLDEALSEAHWAVATTARHRRHDQPNYEPKTLSKEIIAGAKQGRRVALVFGREDHGLSVEEVSRCEAVLWIPTPEHASLNLAQAVLLVAHNIFEQFRLDGGSATGRTLGGSRGTVSTDHIRKRHTERDERADLVSMEGVVTELTRLMERVGYTRSVAPEKVAISARIALQHAEPRMRDIHAFRGMLARLNWALSNPEVDWQASKSTNKRLTEEDQSD